MAATATAPAAHDELTAAAGAAARTVAGHLLDSGTIAAPARKFDAAIEAHLVRGDEVAALLDAARMTVGHAVDTAYPELMRATAELQSLFAVIDATEASVNRVAGAARAIAERHDVLQRGYEAKHPQGIARLASWLGAGGQRAIDAPVRSRDACQRASSRCGDSMCSPCALFGAGRVATLGRDDGHDRRRRGDPGHPRTCRHAACGGRRRAACDY